MQRTVETVCYRIAAGSQRRAQHQVNNARTQLFRVGSALMHHCDCFETGCAQCGRAAVVLVVSSDQDLAGARTPGGIDGRGRHDVEHGGRSWPVMEARPAEHAPDDTTVDDVRRRPRS